MTRRKAEDVALLISAAGRNLHGRGFPSARTHSDAGLLCGMVKGEAFFGMGSVASSVITVSSSTWRLLPVDLLPVGAEDPDRADRSKSAVRPQAGSMTSVPRRTVTFRFAALSQGTERFQGLRTLPAFTTAPGSRPG
jgi:hypothetical protein